MSVETHQTTHSEKQSISSVIPSDSLVTTVAGSTATGCCNRRWRIVAPGGARLRKAPCFDFPVDADLVEEYGTVVRARAVHGKWVQLDDGYWVPKVNQSGVPQIRPWGLFDACTPDARNMTKSIVVLEIVLILTVLCLTFIIPATGYYMAFWVTQVMMLILIPANIAAIAALGYMTCKRSAPGTPVEGTPNFFHSFLVPVYKEPLDVLQDTLDKLASHPAEWRAKYIVVMAFEDFPENHVKAEELKRLYTGFHTLTFTFHPRGVPGEFQGKHCNCDYSCKLFYSQVQSGEIRDVALDGSDMILTVLDSDILISGKLVEALDRKATNAEDANNCFFRYTMEVCNMDDPNVPECVFWVDCGWCLGVLVNHAFHPLGSACSAYSMTLHAMANKIRFWGVGLEAAAEDEFISIRAFLANMKFESIWEPFGFGTVTGDSKWQTFWARIKQAQRHSWGVQNLGYIMEQGQIRGFHPLYYTFVSMFTFISNTMPITVSAILGLCFMGMRIFFWFLPDRMPETSANVTYRTMMDIEFNGLISIYVIICLWSRMMAYNNYQGFKSALTATLTVFYWTALWWLNMPLVSFIGGYGFLSGHVKLTTQASKLTYDTAAKKASVRPPNSGAIAPAADAIETPVSPTSPHDAGS